MGYDTMPDKELKQRARWDLYLLILRAVAMFFMAAHGLYFILVPLMALLLSYLEIWPDRAIGAVFGDPSRLFAEIHCGHCWPGFECFLVLSERHKPNKLIKNQNASMINADKLKAKMSETIISSAPPAFSSEYLGDELGSLSSCRSKYATTISRTPMNPARSNK